MVTQTFFSKIRHVRIGLCLIFFILALLDAGHVRAQSFQITMTMGATSYTALGARPLIRFQRSGGYTPTVADDPYLRVFDPTGASFYVFGQFIPSVGQSIGVSITPPSRPGVYTVYYLKGSPYQLTTTFNVIGSQTISVSASSSTLANGQAVTLTASGYSGTGAITYQVASGPCSVAGSQLTATGVGTCSVKASIAASTFYLAATSAAISVNTIKGDQSLTLVAPLTMMQQTSAPVSVSGASGTGGVTYQIVSGPCALVGSTLTATGAGTCRISATSAGDANFYAATATVDVLIPKLAQTLTLVASPAALIYGGGAANLSLGGVAGAGAISWSVTGSCALVGQALTPSAAGSCAVTASVAGDANYDPASVTTSIAVAKARPILSLSAPTTLAYGQSGSLALSGRQGTGALSLVASGSCALSGMTITAAGVGLCSLSAVTEADANYLAAGATTSTLVVKAVQPLALAAPATLVYLQSAPLVVSGRIGSGALSLTASGPCSVSGSTIVASGVGSCLVTARVETDAFYEAATAMAAINLLKADAPLTLTAASSLVYGQATSLTLTGRVGTGALSLSASGPCTISGMVVAATGVGPCVVTANVEADATYLAASATTTITLVKATPVLTLTGPASLTYGRSATLSLIGRQGTGALTLTTSGPCVLAGMVLTATGTGACLVSATLDADPNYEAAAVSLPVTLTRADSSLVLAGPASLSYGQSATLTLSGRQGTGALSYMATGPCSVLGSTVTATGVGLCTVTARVEADSNYSAATSNALAISVDRALRGVAGLMVTPATLAYGQTGALSASVSAGGGAIVYSVVSGPCSVSGAAVTAAGVGVCTILASVAANDFYYGAQSTFYVLTSTAATQVSLSVDNAAPIVRKPVTLTATIAATSGTNPVTGSVTFKEGAAVLGTAAVAGGAARLSLTGFDLGTHVVVATYSGDAHYAVSTSAPAAIVPVRPDPAQNATVRSMATGQSATVRRFAQTSLQYVSSRLESLHGDTPAFSNQVSFSSRPMVVYDPVAGLISNTQAAQATQAGQFTQAAQAAQRASDDDAAGAPKSGVALAPEASLWTTGEITFNRNKTYQSPTPLQGHTMSVTFGADRHWFSNVRAGVALGVQTAENELDLSGGKVRSKTMTGGAYLSWKVFGEVFVDAAAGYGGVAFRTTRSDPNAVGALIGLRPGTLLFGSLSLSWDQRWERWRYAPYLRMDYQQGALAAYNESGDVNWTLHFQKMLFLSRGMILGFRTQYDIPFKSGVLSPTARIELRHALDVGGAQTVNFVADPVNSYTMSADRSGRNGVTLGAGLRGQGGAMSGQIEYLASLMSQKGVAVQGLRGVIQLGF